MIIGFASYTLITEIVAILEQGLAYFGNVTNIFDSISIFINLSIAINHYWQLEFYKADFQRAIAAIGIGLMYFKLFYWCRLFPQFALTYRVLYDTILSIKTFFILLLTVLFAFANIKIILDGGRGPTDTLVNEL